VSRQRRINVKRLLATNLSKLLVPGTLVPVATNGEQQEEEVVVRKQ